MSRILLFIFLWSMNCNCVRALDLRLPHHVIPKSYDIQLSPQYEESNNLSGFVRIEVECVVEGSKNITLHAKFLNITHLDIKEKVYKTDISINNSSVEENGTDFVLINLSENLQNGSIYILTMNYTTTSTETKKSLFFGGDDQIRGFVFYKGVYYTQLQPIYARTVFPCFDEPSFKSVFNITLRRPKNMTSISNMPIKETIKPENSEVFVHDIFDSTPLMSTYLVAFIITNYKNETIPFNNTEDVRIWTPEEEDKSKTYLASRVTPILYEYLNEYFGIELPIPKLDMFAIPEIETEGLENWGLITFKPRTLLIDENVSSVRSLFLKENIIVTIAHELTHQWMGNLVTLSWWNEVWLQKGITTYLSYLASSIFFFSEEGSWDRFIIFVFQDAMKVDPTIFSQPIKTEIDNNKELFSSFHSIVYSKGASIIRMLSDLIGEENIQKVFKNLIQKNNLKNINEDLFWEEINEVVSLKKNITPQNLTLKDLMESWLTQKGYPVINVSPNYENGSLQIYQNELNGNVWWVPLKYDIIDKYGNGIQKLIWLKDSNLSQTFQDEDLKESSHSLYPVIFNVNQTGYYRVNYNDDNWKRITHCLLRNHSRINKYNRAQLIDDSFYLASRGLLSYVIPFNITTYLPNEDQPLIWITFFEKLSEITSKTFRIENDDKLKGFFMNITQKLFDIYHEEYLESKDFLHKKLWQLSTQWSCKFDNSKCIQRSLLAVEDWMQNITHIPNEDIFEASICAAVRNGNESLWDFVATQYSSVDKSDQLLAGLACSTNNTIIEKYLNMTRENQTFNSRADFVFDKICETQNGRSSFIDFFLNEHEQLSKLNNFILRYDMEQTLYKVLELSDSKTRFEEVAKLIMEKVKYTSEDEMKNLRDLWDKNQAIAKVVNDWMQENILSL
ncbi:aminopeptidase Ey isoform X2 [Lepeophtheirus salmonis]|uniref:aminopeptidase Ey isoform X2 n=1 Tax=Lepeophtheirus salmonis TaxID=72036 RepID=UPI003AF3B330